MSPAPDMLNELIIITLVVICISVSVGNVSNIEAV